MEITRRVLLVISSPPALKDICTCALAQKICYLTLSQENVTSIQEHVQKMLLPQSDRCQKAAKDLYHRQCYIGSTLQRRCVDNTGC